MDNTNKRIYLEFCKKSFVPIFSQPWWMDAVCGEENWDVWNYKPGQQVLAAMPYYISEREGLRLITKAPLTQNNGIIFSFQENQKKNCTRLDFEEKVMNAAIDIIEGMGIDHYEQQFHYCVANYLPYYWREYKALPRYTYVIEDTSDMEKVELEFMPNVRSNIRKAKRIVNVEEIEDIKLFWDINRLTFERQGIKVPYSFELMQRLDNACKENNARTILAARDEAGNVHAVMYLVYDQRSVYLLIAGADYNFRNSQAHSLLVYEGIKLASKLGKSFDFEGSMIQPIERFFRDYGGKQKLYFRIYKTLNPQISAKIY